jgi:hypothetical protein
LSARNPHRHWATQHHPMNLAFRDMASVVLHGRSNVVDGL